jgi:hypothetical protein
MIIGLIVALGLSHDAGVLEDLAGAAEAAE